MTGSPGYRVLTMAAALFLAAAQPAFAAADTYGSGDARSFSAGPGFPAMPYSDTYAAYQWAIQNTGVLKLVPNARTADGNPVAEKQDDTDGPAWESETTLRSVPGIDLNILGAWKKYDARQEKRDVVIALIDTGVDYSHPELADAVWVNEGEIPGDGIDNDGNGYVDDVYGWNFYDNNNQVFTGTDDNHGTHSAGTIAAARDGFGIAGICDSAHVKIMVLKTLGTSTGVGTASNVARAIRYARDNGAVICNLSFGTSKYSEELYQAMKDSGMLFVVAAGNGDESGKGYNIDEKPVYPASFDLDNIISVANLRLDGELDKASNFGAVSVDLAAPGNYILSTMAGGGYGYMSGTSMAAPMVTGAAAMLYSYDTSLSILEVKGRLLSSVRRLSSLNGKMTSGGMLDVSAAMAMSGK